MKTIWKYKLEGTDIQTIEIPQNAQILTVQEQKGEICMWCLVNTYNGMISKTIRIIGTGHEIEENFKGVYIDTFQLANGSLVFHVFEIK